MTAHGTLSRRALWSALAVLIVGSAPLRAEFLELELINRAPKILQFLKDKHCANVGVLPFHVGFDGQTGDGEIGAFHMDVADRLAVALVLADDNQSPIGVIRRAADVARAKLPGADSTTVKGRLRLFDATYPLAWGDEKVRPGGFLAGDVRVSKNVRDLTVRLQFIGPDGGEQDVFGGELIRAQMRSSGLAGAGMSFLLRGVGRLKLVPEADQEAEALQSAQSVKDGTDPFPLDDKDRFVDLEILYDGKVQPYQIDHNRASIPEPTGKSVAFRLKRKAGVAERLGVVLKVNGYNTLYKQRLANDWQCRKWLLLNDKPMTITGFQIAKTKEEPFTVLSEPASKEIEREDRSNEALGTVTMTVFRERQRGEETARLVSEAGAVNRGFLPSPAGEGPAPPDKESAAPWPATVGLLRQQLLRNAQPPTRGVVWGNGGEADSPTSEEPFDASPRAIMGVVVTYRSRPKP